LKYGLRYFDADGREWRLLQIAAGPRLTLGSQGRHFWCASLPVEWEVYECSEGVFYESEAEARRLAERLGPKGPSAGPSQASEGLERS